MSRSKRRPPTKSGKRVYPRTRTINWRWSTPTQREVEKVHVSRYLGTLNSWEIMREHCGENLRKKIALKLPNWQLADSQKDSYQTIAMEGKGPPHPSAVRRGGRGAERRAKITTTQPSCHQPDCHSPCCWRSRQVCYMASNQIESISLSRRIHAEG